MSDFAGNSAKLAVECIKNSHMRYHYTTIAKQTSEAILAEARHAETLSLCQQRDIWEGASRKAYTIRNDSLQKTRQQISVTALNFSKIIKEKMPTFQELTQKYSRKLFGEEFAGDDHEGLPFINPAKEKLMFEAIIRASGRTNSIINTVSRVFGYVGYVALLLTIYIVLYSTYKSDNPTAFIINCGVTLCGGVLGSHFGSIFGSFLGHHFRFGHVTIFVMAVTCGICGGVTVTIICDITISTMLCTVFKFYKPSAIWG